MKISNRFYDVLKWVSIVCIPAILTFLSVVLGVLDVAPKTVNVVVTIISAVGTLIGTLIGVSSVNYKKDKGGTNE